jgi:hypothetical protein
VSCGVWGCCSVLAAAGPRILQLLKVNKAIHDEHLKVCREVFADMSRRLQDKTHW